jgi:hypothetical protein
LATIVIKPLQTVTQIDKEDQYVYTEAASQGYLAGAPVVFSSGKIAESEADIGDAGVWGIALSAASGTTNAKTKVARITPSTLIEGNYIKADGTAGEVSAITLLGTTLAITEYGSTGKYGFSPTGTGHTGCVNVVAISPKDAVGDTGGRLICAPLSAKCASLV